jgi:hypothetical protein
MSLSPLPPLSNSYENTGELCGKILEIEGLQRHYRSRWPAPANPLRFARNSNLPRRCRSAAANPRAVTPFAPVVPGLE